MRWWKLVLFPTELRPAFDKQPKVALKRLRFRLTLWRPKSCIEPKYILRSFASKSWFGGDTNDIRCIRKFELHNHTKHFEQLAPYLSILAFRLRKQIGKSQEDVIRSARPNRVMNSNGTLRRLAV